MTSRTIHTFCTALALLVLSAVLASCVSSGSSGAVVTSRTSKNYAVVKAKQGDSFESLANRYLKDPDEAWIISSYNRTSSIKAGDLIIIPVQPLNRGGIHENGFQAVPVLAYAAFSADHSDAITVKQSDFEQQMQLLKDKGYTPITLDRFYDFLDFREMIPEKSVVITIDDVGQGTYDIAFPILKKFGYPAAVFLTTDIVTGKGTALDWDKVRTMRDANISIQHRTKTLRNLTRRKKDETFEEYVIAVDRELTVANNTFKKELGATPDYLSYPFGASNEMVVSLLQKNNFRGGLGLGGGTNPFFINNYEVQRIAIPGTMSLSEFESSLVFFIEGVLQ